MMEVFVLEKGHIMQELISFVNFESDLSVCIENVLYKWR